MINGPNLWLDIGRDLVQPPSIKRHTRSPRKQRKKDDMEAEIGQLDPIKISKKLIPTCSKCKQKGHNMRSCKRPSSAYTPKDISACDALILGSSATIKAISALFESHGIVVAF